MGIEDQGGELWGLREKRSSIRCSRGNGIMPAESGIGDACFKEGRFERSAGPSWPPPADRDSSPLHPSSGPVSSATALSDRIALAEREPAIRLDPNSATGFPQDGSPPRPTAPFMGAGAPNRDLRWLPRDTARWLDLSDTTVGPPEAPA
jgi:hypothetical protein